jgi:hypothetical protein
MTSHEIRGRWNLMKVFFCLIFWAIIPPFLHIHIPLSPTWGVKCHWPGGTLSYPPFKSGASSLDTLRWNAVFFFVHYFFMLTVSRLYSIKWYDDGWTLNWKVYGRKQLLLNWGIIPAPAWQYWRNLQKTSVGIVDDLKSLPEYKSRVSLLHQPVWHV